LRPQRFGLNGGQLKHEIFRESSRVPSNCLIQSFRCYTVEFRKVNVEHDTMAPDGENPLGDTFRPKARQQCVGLRLQIPDHAVAIFN
jgi:hypothetical protein